MIRLNELGHRYDRQWLFRGVCAEIGPGDRLLISGPNGSGKSTLLKALVGLIWPSEGTVEVPERVGYSAIDLSVYPNLTVEEQLHFSSTLRGAPVQADLLARVGLDHARNKMGGSLSTGMKARLKLALALQIAPELLVLDEPTAAMDEAGRLLIEEIITTHKGAVVYASNDPADHKWASHELKL